MKAQIFFHLKMQQKNQNDVFQPIRHPLLPIQQYFLEFHSFQPKTKLILIRNVLNNIIIIFK